MEMKKAKIADLTLDNLNANKGTQYGQHLIEHSLQKFGAGRSILLDRNNRIIAGNKTIENAGSIGMEDIIIVETTGKEIVAVKRMDIDLDSQQGREMALADNATSKANIEWDEENIQKIQSEWDVPIEEWMVLSEFGETETIDNSDKIASAYKIEITFDSEKEQETTYNQLISQGYSCRILTL